MSKRHTITVMDFLTHVTKDELASNGTKKLVVLVDVLHKDVMYRVERGDGFHEGFETLAEAVDRYNEL